MGDGPRHQGASYLAELQVVFMEAEYCHLLFISLSIFKMGLTQLAKTFGQPCVIYKAALADLVRWPNCCEGRAAA